jgi:sigma-B regulation protein RsbU (phosphoserine phosphatase)
LLERRLGVNGFRITVATDGDRALDLLRRHEFDLVLLDIELPGISGFETLQRIRAERGNLELPVIMVTSRNGSGDVVRALDAGANDYVTKPIDFPVALARIRTHLRLRHARDAIVESHQQTIRDLDAAAKMQRALLPNHLVVTSGLRCGWHYQPSDRLGGDLLNVFWITDRYLGFYVLDVSGHGIPSALMSVAVSRSLSPHLRQGSVIVELNPQSPTPRLVAPAEVARRLNLSYPMQENGGLFFTLQYGILDLVERRLSFVSAGHPNPIRISGGMVQDIECAGGPPIGVDEAAEYVDASVPLARGDRIMLFSDGMYEQRNASGEPLGLSRLKALVADLRCDTEQAADRLVANVRRWSACTPFRDDITVLALEIA